MTPPRASVIVVSRHRPASLRRCVISLQQQDHPDFEVIIVADPEGIATVRQMGLNLKLVVFDQANISAARNAGLQVAAGDVIAFIDDDAAAEPTWLTRLTLPLRSSQVIASTGFIRGRNGISYQWRACEVDHLGQDHPIEATKPMTRASTPQRAVKTQGTNCAFRRETLCQIGGFDPALRFFLDEADVNLRLAGFGLTAIEPLAEVHHGYQASARRRVDRVPLSLHEIAASTAVFLRRHAGEADLEPGRLHLSCEQESRLSRFTAQAKLTANAAKGLLESLESGWQDGLARPLAPLDPILPNDTDFLAFGETGPRAGVVISGRFWQRNRLLKQALAARAQGLIVSVLCLAPTQRAHHIRFTDDGIWWQEGGLFGRTEREEPRFRWNRFAIRVLKERARIGLVRQIE